MELEWYQFTDAEGSPKGDVMIMEPERAATLTALMAKQEPTWALCKVGAQPFATLVDKVFAYARGHYDTGGWDVIVEARTAVDVDALLYRTVGGAGYDTPCTTLEEALMPDSLLSAVIDVWGDQQAAAKHGF